MKHLNANRNNSDKSRKLETQKRIQEQDSWIGEKKIKPQLVRKKKREVYVLKVRTSGRFI